MTDDTLIKENNALKRILARSAEPCIYCKLSAADMNKCASGFPGCARADDYGLDDEVCAAVGGANCHLGGAPAMSDWQLISTAPKDGTVIDVWLGDADEIDVQFYCTRGTRRAPGWHWHGGKWRPDTGLTTVIVFVQPTHWQPLPRRPSCD